LRAPDGPGIPLTLSGAITPATLGMLCARVRDLLADGPGEPVVCDVSRLSADLEAVDALGRLQLDARRLGGSIALTGTSARLWELLEICGLTGALPPAGRSAG
jgi:ABC-type transporter Mla MlaB component